MMKNFNIALKKWRFGVNFDDKFKAANMLSCSSPFNGKVVILNQFSERNTEDILFREGANLIFKYYRSNPF